MNWTTRTLVGLLGIGLMGAMGAGCSSQPAEDDDSGDELNAAGNISKAGEWVVDLKAAAEKYGSGSKYFLGIDGADLGGAQAGFPPGTIVWDQTFRFGSDHKAVDPSKEFPAVKDASGKIFGPKGRFLNIIPLLKDTDPTKQAHLRSWLKNGDILMFFHPEQNTMRNAMDRRASHVAMHYDYKSPYNDKEFVHHVDNPNNYGPRYNYTPETHMPFHVFRYQPKGVPAATAANYALAARNWSFITDDLSPFADFFTLNLQRFDQLKAFRDAALSNQPIPSVYCSGLAFTNLNLGLNYPLKASDLGNRTFNREETAEKLDARVLAPRETADLQGINRLVFEPYTPSELATVWLDNTYAHLPVQMRQGLAKNPAMQQQVAQGFMALEWSDVEGKQAPTNGRPPAVSSPENMKAWGESYGLKAGDETAAFLNRDDIKISGEDGQTMTLKAALALPENANIDKAQPAAKILRELEIRYIKNRFVPPRIWADSAEDRFWANPAGDARTESNSDIVYVGTVLNCELLAAADGSNKDACKLENADGIGAGSDEFSQGGADTATYPEYAVPNGGERSHRRFDARTGPDAMGKGSKIVVRATASDIADVKFLFHTPAMYADAANEQLYSGGKWAQLSSLTDSKAFDAACTRIYTEAQTSSRHGSCAPVQGILLDPAKLGAPTGAANDLSMTFDLTKVCTIKDAKTMTCPVVSQKRDGSGWDLANVKTMDVSREVPKGEKPAYVDATMVELGSKTDAQTLDNCSTCGAGGAQFNQWTVTLRNDQ
jgi:hypothetical protein